MNRWSKAYWTDLGERVGATFLATLIPLYVATSNAFQLDWVTDLEIAGSAAGLSLLKGLAANLASPGSGPSAIPSPPAPPVEPVVNEPAPVFAAGTPNPAAMADLSQQVADIGPKIADSIRQGIAAAGGRPDLGVPRVGIPGVRPPINAPAIAASRILTGATVTPPASADELAELYGGWKMLGNNLAGDCVAVTWANFRRLVTALLAGHEVYPTQAQVWEMYRTQNPDFTPNGSAQTNGPGSPADGGMDVQTFLNYLVKNGGPDGVKPLAFAKVDVTNLDELRTAAALFGLWLAVDVTAAQQQQFANGEPWDYVKGSPLDGGHSILSGGEDAASLKIITWAEETALTKAFLAHQLQQAWLVIWPEHVGTQAFQQGVDLATLAADYKALTGRDFPIAPPAPVPAPGPAPDVDAALASHLTTYVHTGHVAGLKATAEAWLAAQGK